MAGEPIHEPTRREWLGFWSMIVQQTQNAFNDKAAQFILVPLGGAIGVAVESWATVMIALPFVLFAPLAGWLSDRFSKRDVMLGAAIAQLLILGWLCGAILLRQMPLALIGFFALAVQSAFFSPAKIGMNKELVGSRHLGFAAGVQQMMAILAILAGQIIAGIVYDLRYAAAGGVPAVAWQAALLPMIVLGGLAVGAIFMAWVIPRVPAQGAPRPSWSLAIRHFRHLRELWDDLPLRQASFGVAFFWGFATFINLWSVKLAKVLTDGQEGFGTLSSWFMASASLGMACGFGTAAYLLRRRIEIGWVPVAGVMMTVMALVLATIDPARSLALIDGGIFDWRAVVRPSTGAFLWGLILLAYFAALFLSPLNAWMQDRYPSNKRGELQSAVNLQDCLAGIAAAGFIELVALIFRLMDLPPLLGYQLTIALGGLGCGLITYYIIRLLPGDFARVIGLTVLRLFYRIRPVHDERMPGTGGVLLLPNHVSWADAFFLTAGSPRPVRFVMDAAFLKHRPIRWFCRIFDTVPLAIDKPREALRTAGRALAKGDVVCMFPEGQLTRTGTLQELKRGFELIARKSGAPVVPAWLDGVWGSIFSYERRRFFRKVPYRVPYGLGVVFGDPIPGPEADLEAIRRGILRASADAVEARMPGWRRTDSPRHTANGYQLGQIAALPRRKAIMRLENDPDLDDLQGLNAFSKLYRAPILRDPGKKPHSPHWVGGRALRRRLLDGDPPVEHGVFFDFGDDALARIDRDGWLHCPCLAIDGIIVAMSMPDPPAGPGGLQPGRREGSFGRLLPGFTYRTERARIVLEGPALEPGGLALADGMTLDRDGFLLAPPDRP
jgi:acyl-[acyl-carrier-protein]-phospholipid O-acyltransferase/long-chain-fatty-acid--[acyl-carrier-protein] ligase